MTDETKRTLLEYMSGKLENSCGDNIPQFTDLNNKTNNLEDMFKEININFSILGFVESPKTSNILLYGNNSIGKLDYGVIVVLDSEFNVLKIIEGFNNGTRFRQFICLDFDSEGNCYGIDNVENIDEPNKFRFILLNNFLIKLGNEYQVVLRNSYYFPDEYNSMYFEDPRNTNKIMKKDFTNAYYSFFERNDTTLSGRLITLKINVGAENEWKHYDFSEILEPQLFDYSISFLENEIDFDICVINETNFYRLENVGGVINKYFELSLGDISFAQSLIKINNNKIYVTTSKLLENNFYETKIKMISNNKLYEIFSETKESAYLSNICRLINKNNDCFVIRYNFRNDPNVFYNVDFYTGILLDNKYHEKYLGYFELSSYSAGNMFVKNEFNLFKICVLDLNNIKYSNLVYNSLNYNGEPCIQPNSLVPNSGILYQDNMPVFARNLYNKSLNDNLTVSTIEVPNNYLNNILVNREILKSKTNLSLVDKSEQIIKNEYENVYINFLNSINIRNENDPQKPVSNLTGAIRVNNSINLENDVDNTKITKCKIVYDSGKEVIKNIQVDLANNTVTGSNPTLTNSLNKKLNYLKVEGKTVQNGTPTPDIPIEIQNVKGYINLFDVNDKLQDFKVDNEYYIVISEDNTQATTTKYVNTWTKPKKEIKANEIYTICVEIKKFEGKINGLYITSNTSNSKSQFSDKDGTFTITNDEIVVNKKYIKTMTSQENMDDVNIKSMLRTFISIPSGSKASIEFRISVFKGNIEKTYVPYGSNYLELKAYLEEEKNSTLIDLQNNELCEKDTLIVQNGYASIDKTKKILELTGEENWILLNDKENFIEFRYNSKIPASKNINTHFNNTTNSLINMVNNYLILRYPKNANYVPSNLGEFKHWLKDQKANGTPVIVQYELANKENIGLGLQDQLTAYSNVTYVSCDDNLHPNLEVNYLINENYSTLSTTIYVDELLKELQFISNDEKTVYQIIDISNLQVGNYYTINQRMEVK